MASTNTWQEGLVPSLLFDTDEWVLRNAAGFRNVGSTIDRVTLISAVSGPGPADQADDQTGPRPAETDPNSISPAPPYHPDKLPLVPHSHHTFRSGRSRPCVDSRKETRSRFRRITAGRQNMPLRASSHDPPARSRVSRSLAAGATPA